MDCQKCGTELSEGDNFCTKCGAPAPTEPAPPQPAKPIMPFNEFQTNIAGVTFNNENGTSRQVIIRLCKVGDLLILKHEPVEQDENAIKVFRMNGDQLGFLPKGYAPEVAYALDQGEAFHVIVEEKTRFAGTDGKMKWGCRIKVTKQSYVDSQRSAINKGCFFWTAIIVGIFIVLIAIIAIIMVSC